MFIPRSDLILHQCVTASFHSHVSAGTGRCSLYAKREASAERKQLFNSDHIKLEINNDAESRCWSRDLCRADSWAPHLSCCIKRDKVLQSDRQQINTFINECLCSLATEKKTVQLPDAPTTHFSPFLGSLIIDDVIAD